jgi:hypothetical protein
MSAERLQDMSEQYGASELIPHFPRLRAIREHYGRLETANYRKPWEYREILDGAKGDLGDLSKLEAGRRGMRTGYSPEKIAHEVVDVAWSAVVSADSVMVDPAKACIDADAKGPLEGTPRQMINRISLALGMIDEIVDKPADPLFAHTEGDRMAMLTGWYVEVFRAVMALANAYEIDLPEEIEYNMAILERAINNELSQVQ